MISYWIVCPLLLVSSMMANAGTLSWEFIPEVPERFLDPPLLSDNSLFARSERGTLYCINNQTGALQWKQLNTGGSTGSPLQIFNGMVLVGGGGMSGFGVVDGEKKWSLAPLRHWLGWSMLSAYATVSDDALFISRGHRFSRIDINSKDPVWIKNTEVLFQREGSCVKDAVIVGDETEPIVYCFDAKTGKKRWQHKFKGGDGFYNRPLTIEEDVIVQDKSGIVCRLRTQNGDEKWRVRLPSFLRCEGVAHGNQIFVSEGENSLVCLDASTGKTMWRKKTQDLISIDKTMDGRIMTIENSDDKSTARYYHGEDIEYEVALPAQTIEKPVLKNGRLFVVSKSGRIYCFDMQAR